MTGETKGAETKGTAMQPATTIVDPSKYEFWDVGTYGFRVAWLTLLVIHAFCAYFYIISGILYKRTVGSVLEAYLNVYQIGMKTDGYPTVAGVHYLFGVLHLIMGSLMLLWSLYRRRFSFGPLQELATRAHRTSSKVASRIGASKTTAGATQEAPRAQRRFVGLAGRVWARLFDRTGLFGVEGKYFEHLLMAREVLETTLQMIQAYRMSEYLARPWLNRFYLGILVVNCWVGPLVHVVCRRNKMKRRALALLCDGALDLMSAIGVSSLIMLSFYEDYDYKLGGFASFKWYDDRWFVRTVSELQILLVASWSDLCSRVVFSVGLLACLESVKEVLREAPGSVASSTADGKDFKAINAGSTTPNEKQLSAPAAPSIPPRRQSRRLKLVSSFRNARSSWERYLLQFVNGSLLAVGVVALCFHLHAESIETVHQCVIQLHPWTSRAPACLLLRLDCHYSIHVGSSTEATKEWRALDLSYTRRVLMMHCSALDMPPLLQGIHNLIALKMYNMTINQWAMMRRLLASPTLASSPSF
ncbi:hypothetical protein PINS_up018319 [Pythium insidiosum]|nr:hypothetical protein PINS_up018319 [Pythium insidiosum]